MCAAKGWLVSHRRSVHDDEAHFRRTLSNSNRRESNAGLKLNAILYSKATTRLLTHLAGKLVFLSYQQKLQQRKKLL